MNTSNQTIFSEILKELEATNEANCALQLLKIVESLGKLARGHWLRKGKGDLWLATKEIWLDLREQVLLHARKTDANVLSTDNYFKATESPTLRNIIFLAEKVTESTTPTEKQKLLNHLGRFLLKSKAESSSAYRAIESIVEVLGYQARPIVPRETPYKNPMEVFETTPDHDLPTLTSRRIIFGQSARGVLNVQVGFREPPDLYELMLEVHRGDEQAIFKILKTFDATNSPRVKNSCVEALRLIGGCLVAQELSDRVATNPLYAQCLVLCALDGLALQPYRPANGASEPLTLQQETVRIVLRRLLEYDPHSPDLRAIRDNAIEGVKRHKTECGAG